MKKVLIALAMVLLVPVIFAGCSLFDTDFIKSPMQMNFMTTQNDITLKTKSYSEGSYAVKLKTPKNKSHVIFTFEIKNNTATAISLDIDSNFVAKINTTIINEAENINKEYNKAIPTSISANTTEAFEVGYLLDENWTKIDFEFSPAHETVLTLNCSKTTITYKMMSQSMNPTIPMGTDVEFQVLNHTGLSVGCVVAFYNQGQIWISRIIAVSYDANDMPLYTTKGDANASANAGTISNEDIIGWTQDYMASWTPD